MPHYLNISLASLVGASLVLSFSPFGLYFFPFVLFPYFFYLINKFNHHKSLIFAFGFSFFSVGLYWLIPCIVNYGGASWVVAIILCAIFYLFLSLFFTPFLLTKKFGLLTSISFFSLFEVAREYVFTGFPWLSIGFSQTNNPLLNNYFSFFGSNGVTLIVLIISYYILQCFIKPFEKAQSIGIIVLLVSLNFLLPFFEDDSSAQDRINVSLVQGNIHQSIKWDKDSTQEQINKYTKLLKEAKGDLIIFPETTIPMLYRNYPDSFKSEINAKVIDGKTVIIGSIIKKNDKFLNGAVVSDNEQKQIYFKKHLVPFGEYYPLSKYLGFVYTKILDIPFSNLSPPIISNKIITYKDLNLGLNICYEDIFKSSYDQFMPDVHLFINLTNDAWYDRSPAAHQHLQIAQARALEFKRSVLRSTNTGVTAHINNNGLIKDTLPIFTAGILETEVILKRNKSFYADYGYLPLIILILIILLRHKLCMFPLLNIKKKVKS